MVSMRSMVPSLRVRAMKAWRSNALMSIAHARR
jgi:hypothetical protein